jgi:hypothetical protein
MSVVSQAPTAGAPSPQVRGGQAATSCSGDGESAFEGPAQPLWARLSRTAAHLAMNHREWSLEECVRRAASADAEQDAITHDVVLQMKCSA